MYNVCVCYPSLSVTLYHKKWVCWKLKKNLLTKPFRLVKHVFLRINNRTPSIINNFYRPNSQPIRITHTPYR